MNRLIRHHSARRGLVGLAVFALVVSGVRPGGNSADGGSRVGGPAAIRSLAGRPVVSGAVGADAALVSARLPRAALAPTAPLTT
ncbi:MAG TPA: hypothetical protein VHM48_13995, partial [Candidatus Limnocylindrales bacterium]|nr:hypothetical protein [Candidatus Limnocylindrales bacterium]